jgi:hypothetical protein
LSRWSALPGHTSHSPRAAPCRRLVAAHNMGESPFYKLFITFFFLVCKFHALDSRALLQQQVPTTGVAIMNPCSETLHIAGDNWLII